MLEMAVAIKAAFTDYAHSVARYWWLVLGGGVLTIMDLAERALGTWWLPPAWAKWTTLVTGLVIA